MSRPDAGFAMRPIGAGTGADPTERRPKVRGVLCAVGDLVEDIVVWLAGAPGEGTDTEARVFRRRGGSAANVAALCAANGTPARFVGHVGADDLGDRLLATLSASGVDVRVRRGGRTGTIVVLVAPGGERTMLTDRGAALRPRADRRRLARRGRCAASPRVLPDRGCARRDLSDARASCEGGRSEGEHRRVVGRRARALRSGAVPRPPRRPPTRRVADERRRAAAARSVRSRAGRRGTARRPPRSRRGHRRR